MENRYVLKFKWTKKRSKDKALNGNPICTLYVNDFEKVSIMIPRDNEDDLKLSRYNAFTHWLRVEFPELMNSKIFDVVETDFQKFIFDLDYRWSMLIKGLIKSGYIFTELASETNLDIYMIEKNS